MNLNQVTIPSSDIERSVEFYKKLGLNLIVYSEKHYARFECPDGHSTFSLSIADELPEKSSIKIYFECNELEKKVSELQEKGINFASLLEDKRWKWTEAHLEDPDGNHLVLYFAGENRLNPPWRINS